MRERCITILLSTPKKKEKRKVDKAYQKGCQRKNKQQMKSGKTDVRGVGRIASTCCDCHTKHRIMMERMNHAGASNKTLQEQNHMQEKNPPNKNKKQKKGKQNRCHCSGFQRPTSNEMKEEDRTSQEQGKIRQAECS